MALDFTFERNDHTYEILRGEDDEGNEFWKQPALSGRDDEFDLAIKKNGDDMALFARGLKDDAYGDDQDGINAAFQEAMYILKIEERPVPVDPVAVAQREYAEAFTLYMQVKEMFGPDHQNTLDAQATAQQKYEVWQNLLNP